MIGRWTNFLLACVNCNSSKGTKPVVFANTLLPDRDNTFAAFEYAPDGKIVPSSALKDPQRKMAASLLALTGLDKLISESKDATGKLIALDRVSQRMEVWLVAEEARTALRKRPNNHALKESTTKLALASGHFSIWMTVFEGHAEMRQRFIAAFPGTRESGCFHPSTTKTVRGANPDGLPSGGKV